MLSEISRAIFLDEDASLVFYTVLSRFGVNNAGNIKGWMVPCKDFFLSGN